MKRLVPVLSVSSKEATLPLEPRPSRSEVSRGPTHCKESRVGGSICTIAALSTAVFLTHCSSGPGASTGDDAGNVGSDAGEASTGVGSRDSSSDAGLAADRRASDTGSDSAFRTPSDSGGDSPPVYASDGGPATTATRPSYNTGDGFFVKNGGLYDANGNLFRIRGVDRNHYDSNSAAGIARTNANTVRIFVETNYGASWSDLAGVVQNDHIAHHQVPIVTAASSTAGTLTSGSSDPSLCADVVANSWIAPASTWTPLNKYILINLCNEWGPADSSAWATTYETAIPELRKAGYLGPIVIDSGGSGQNDADFELYSQEVFESDPQKNIVFSLHIYGQYNDYEAGIKSVQKGNPTVVTLNSDSACHPFAPTYCATAAHNNTYSGINTYFVTGALGMTELNGKQPNTAGHVGGTPGAWTITLNVDSTSWTDYTGGATMVDDVGNYAREIARLAALRDTTGAAYIIGEFGPGRNVGPSPTMVTPFEILAAAEANGIGWIGWAWDDNDQSAGSDNDWFGMTYHTGAYTQESDLTIFGQQMVEGCTNPTPGGCGCPDFPPVSQLTTAQLNLIEPGCKSALAPTYQTTSLKLGVPATIF